VAAGLFAKIANRVRRVAVFCNFDQRRTAMLAVFVAPTAIFAAVAVKRTKWVKFLSSNVKPFFKKAFVAASLARLS
jgi:hypothetical protein